MVTFGGILSNIWIVLHHSCLNEPNMAMANISLKCGEDSKIYSESTCLIA